MVRRNKIVGEVVCNNCGAKMIYDGMKKEYRCLMCGNSFSEGRRW
jgi:tRNA(Ile2) C34 agmatinyltransferase TiaS